MTENSSPKKPTLPVLFLAGVCSARTRFTNVLYSAIIAVHVVVLVTGTETWMLNASVIAFIIAISSVFNTLSGRNVLREAASAKKTVS